MASIFGNKRPLQIADVARALAYSSLGTWALFYLLFPPVAFSALAVYTRIIWLGFTVIGALVATIGSLSRLDYKVELPGLMFMCIGPLFYTFVNLWFFLVPSDLSGPVMIRLGYAFMTMAVLGLLLPRVLDLYSDALKAQAFAKATDGLTDLGEQ